MGEVHLGPAPRVPVARFTLADGTVTAWYVVPPDFEPPDGAVGVDVRQLPGYPGDWPAAEDPSWLNDEPQPMLARAPARPEVRGPDRFRGGPAGLGT
jgi:hypothetical protein